MKIQMNENQMIIPVSVFRCSLEISINTYAAVEQNKSDITLSRLEKIASIFEMPLEEIIAFGTNHFHAYNNSGGFNGNYISNVSLTEGEKIEQRIAHLEVKFAAIEHQLDMIIKVLKK